MPNEEKKISFLPKEEKERVEKELKEIKKAEKKSVEYVSPKKEKEGELAFSEEKSNFLLLGLKSFFKTFLSKLKPKKEVRIKKEKIIAGKIKKKGAKHFLTLAKESEAAPSKIKTDREKMKEEAKQKRQKEKASKVMAPEIIKEKEGEEEMTMPTEKRQGEEEIEVSLIPGEAIESPISKKGLLPVVLWGIISLVAIGGFYLTLKLNEKKISKEILLKEQAIKEVNQELNDLAKIKSKTKILETKIQRSQNLLDQHIYWTNFFSLLEKYTLPAISYAGLNADTEKEIALKTQAPDYRTVARQLLVLQSAKDFIQQVTVSGLKFTEKDGQAAVNFNLNLVLAENVFKYRSK